MRILLADDLLQVRRAIRLVLETLPEARIVAELGHARELESSMRVVNPDVLLLDWELPGIDALGGAPWILGELRREHPETRVVVLSLHPEAGRLALEMGGDAFVSKLEPPDRLFATLARLERAQQDLSLGQA